MRAGSTQTRLLQLPNDVLKHILLLVAMSSDGAKDIVRVSSVSKGLKKLAMSKEILRAISFPKQLPSSESFWERNGLIIKSARARNLRPYRVIMKRIKEKIDDAYGCLDFAIPLVEECNAKVKSGVPPSLMSEEITRVKYRVGKIVRRTNLNILRAESMINAFGRRFFRHQKLLVRFEILKPKYDKCCNAFDLLEKSADV